VDRNDSHSSDIAPASHCPDVKAVIPLVATAKKVVCSIVSMQATVLPQTIELYALSLELPPIVRFGVFLPPCFLAGRFLPPFSSLCEGREF